MPVGFQKSDAVFGAYSRKAYIILYCLLESKKIKEKDLID